jgi:phospholipid/cholesterol/gamma-HCH transport system ATP-binding protein
MPATATARSSAADAAESPVLRIDAVGVRFGRHEVLRDISIDLAAGETLVILGESGCGKTVLLKTMIGLVRPTVGEVFFEGRSLARMSDRELAHLRTRYGFVFQGAALFDSHTVADNIAFPLREHTRVSEAEIREIVTSLVDEVGLPRTVLGACGSGPASPGPSPSTRNWCSTTNRPPASTRS